MFTVLTIETSELGNTIIETIECVGIFDSFEEALATCTDCLRADIDAVIEFEEAA